MLNIPGVEAPNSPSMSLIPSPSDSLSTVQLFLNPFFVQDVIELKKTYLAQNVMMDKKS